MIQNGNIAQSGNYNYGLQAAVMIATSQNTVNSALRTSIIYEIHTEPNEWALNIFNTSKAHKMAAVLQTTYPNAFLQRNRLILFEILLKFPKCSI